MNATTTLSSQDFRPTGKNTTYVEGKQRVSRARQGVTKGNGELRVINRISMRMTLADRQRVKAIISTMLDKDGLQVFPSIIEFNHEAIAQFLSRKPFMSRDFIAPKSSAPALKKDREGSLSETWVPFLIEVEPAYENAMENWRIEYNRRTGQNVSKGSWFLSAIRYFFKLLAKQ